MADILYVHDVCHDYGFRRRHHSISHNRISPQHDGAGRVPLCRHVWYSIAGFFLGYLADRIGRKKSIILGLVLFALNSYMFSVGRSFAFFEILLVISGVAIGIFRTGALALIGDISQSTVKHTAAMNSVEGFFAVGAIIGPAIVARLLAAHGCD